MKKTLRGKSFKDSPKPRSMEEMRSILSKKNGAERLMKDFTSRYPLVAASAHLNLIHLHAQGDLYRELDADEQKRMEEFSIAMNELLMAVYHFCGETKKEG